MPLYHSSKNIVIKSERFVYMSKHHHNDRFEIVKENCGSGMHARVSVIRRASDGKLLIWKRPISDKSEHHEALMNEVKRSKYWRKFGVSDVKVRWHPDRHSLLKTYIKGKTLTQILENDPGFFSKKESKSVKALGKFVRLLINSRHYIQNLSCENLVFDGKKWQVIDSSNIKGKESRSKTKRDYKKKFFGIWSKRVHSDNEIRSLKSFLEKYSH